MSKSEYYSTTLQEDFCLNVRNDVKGCGFDF